MEGIKLKIALMKIEKKNEILNTYIWVFSNWHIDFFI